MGRLLNSTAASCCVAIAIKSFYSACISFNTVSMPISVDFHRQQYLLSPAMGHRIGHRMCTVGLYGSASTEPHVEMGVATAFHSSRLRANIKTFFVIINSCSGHA